MKKTLGRFGRFAIASALSVAGIFGGTILLHEAGGLKESASYGITLVAVFVVNFLMLRLYVYPEHRRETNAMRQLAATAVSSAVFRVVEFALFILLQDIAGMQYLAAMLIIQPGSFFIKFVYYRRVVFTPNRFIRRQ